MKILTHSYNSPSRTTTRLIAAAKLRSQARGSQTLNNNKLSLKFSPFFIVTSRALRPAH
jgi:hypothetical protein